MPIDILTPIVPPFSFKLPTLRRGRGKVSVAKIGQGTVVVPVAVYRQTMNRDSQAQELGQKPPLANVLWHHLMERGIRITKATETLEECSYETLLNVEGADVRASFSTMEYCRYVQGEIVFPNRPPGDKIVEAIRFFNRLNEVLRLGRFYFSERSCYGYFEAMVYCREARRSHPRIMAFLVDVYKDNASLTLPSFESVIKGHLCWKEAAQVAIDKTRAYDGI